MMTTFAKTSLFLCSVLLVSVASTSQIRRSIGVNPRKGQTSRNGRFLSLFTVVQWGPGGCVAVSGEVGNCVPAGSDCLRRGGAPSGPCAGGYGTCCIFMQTCDGILRENGTYFVNPQHPGATDTTGNCQVTLPKLQPDVCQLRLDFDTFSLAPPEPLNHLCNSDRFLVSGGSAAPIICGNSAGDHMYIDTGYGYTNPVTLTVVTSGPSFPRSWRIRVTQIPCATIYRGEQGCLQYYTGVSGRVKSFNFDSSNGRQLSNQDYSICIRTERNFCSIQYTACPDTANNRSRSFTLTGNSNGAIQAMVGTTGPSSCPIDWLSISCASNTNRNPPNNLCEDRMCGGTFSAEVSLLFSTVISRVRPFRLYFKTDGLETPNDVDNRGFCLDYVQQPCTNSV